MFRIIRAAVLAVCCAGIAVTGCSAKVEVTPEATVSKANLEQGIADALEKSVGQRPDGIECPGPIKAKAGETMRCVLAAGDVRYGLTATITSYADGRAAYDAQVDNQPLG